MLGHFDGGQLVLEEGGEAFRIEGLAGAQLDEGFDRLLAVIVFDAGDGDLFDSRVTVDP